MVGSVPGRYKFCQLFGSGNHSAPLILRLQCEEAGPVGVDGSGGLTIGFC